MVRFGSLTLDLQRHCDYQMESSTFDRGNQNSSKDLHVNRIKSGNSFRLQLVKINGCIVSAEVYVKQMMR